MYLWYTCSDGRFDIYYTVWYNKTKKEYRRLLILPVKRLFSVVCQWNKSILGSGIYVYFRCYAYSDAEVKT